MEQVQSIDEDVRAMIAGILEMEPSAIDGDAQLVQDLGMDSMMALEIVAGLEKKYRIKLPEAVIPTVKTLNSIIALTKQYVR